MWKALCGSFWGWNKCMNHLHCCTGRNHWPLLIVVSHTAKVPFLIILRTVLLIAKNCFKSHPQWGDQMTCSMSVLATLIILLLCKHSGRRVWQGCFSHSHFTTLLYIFVWNRWFTGGRVLWQEGTLYPRGSVLVSHRRWMSTNRWVWPFPPVSAGRCLEGRGGVSCCCQPWRSCSGRQTDIFIMIFWTRR